MIITAGSTITIEPGVKYYGLLWPTMEPAHPPNRQSQNVTSCQPCRIDCPPDYKLFKRIIIVAKELDGTKLDV
ncbi:hypothetical protein M378DRAFT_529047 [Amanita muscaria Koide BX008]|uniref:Uncharacterized protein n=1 Tax=Amanita muscaria (strain Koide BX008) TaxID=946122 RepID=A0A0C2X9I5_AMAMK|nr:hypothetical protein M378DRAFT_529047 [Amanita muscaria Koide BX008]